MKKLSEIGTHLWVRFSSPTMSGAMSGLCHSCEPEHSSGYAKYRAYNEAERRELVEAGVCRFIMDFIGSYELDRCESLGEAIKVMFEEQGI